MAIVTRVNGDAAGVVNVDAGRTLANGVIINTGIAAPLSAYKIAGLTATNLVPELVTGGAVETILRTIALNATILASQVDSNGQISVLVERSGWVNDAAVLAALPTGNIGAVSNVYVGGSTTVSSAGGIKLA